MIFQIDFEPIGRRADAEWGETILDAARRAGLQLTAVCGGNGTCGQCKVQVLDGPVSAVNEAELRSLDESEARDGYRLACQAVVQGSLKVHVPARSLTATQRIQVESLEVAVSPDPPVSTHALQLNRPNVDDIRADIERVTGKLRDNGVEVQCLDLAALRRSPEVLRKSDWSVTAFVRDSELIHIAALGTRALGFAVDLGTTKMAGYLVDLETGRVVASQGVMNPQISYGEDVMARVAYAMEGQEQSAHLSRVVVESLNRMLTDMCGQAGVRADVVVEAVIVGNTAMHHLLLGLPVRQLGLAPYLAAVRDALDVKARDLGLEIAPGGYVHLLPNIAGFVGADHVAMLLATGIYRGDEIVAGLDIGTNTEVALHANGRLITCSTASGPAFEGAHIKDGMRAADGAIERVLLDDGRLEYQTIGDKPAVGICGSGILDAIAQLLKGGVVDRRGAIRPGHPNVRDAEGGREFVVVDRGHSGTGRDIVISRADIGEIQLAKGAMRAGLSILLQTAGIPESALERVVIAGAFGSYIDVESAVTIGMFPRLPLSRFVQVGNAAGMGARMALVSMEQRRIAARIAREAEYVELTSSAEFTDVFAQAMFLA